LSPLKRSARPVELNTMPLRRDDGWSVRTQLLVIVAGVMVLFAGIGAFIGAGTLDEARDRAERDATFQAGLGATAIADALAQSQGAMAGLGTGLDIGALLANPSACHLSSSAAGVFPSAHIDIVLPDGRVACSSVVAQGAPPGASHAGAAWVKAAATAKGPASSAPFDDRLTGRTAIAVTAPVTGTDGRLAAIAAVVAGLDDLSRGLAATYGGPQRFEFAVTGAGGRLLSGSGAVATGGPGTDSSRIGGWRPVDGLDWRVHASVPTAAALGPTRSVLAKEALLALAAFAVMALLIGLVNRRIARPLRQLTEAAGRAARREAAHAPLPSGPAELRRLAGAFNAMVAARDGYEAELSSAYGALERHTSDLERSNSDLELFVYSTSHDLAEPLRTITSWAQLLRRDYGDRLDADGGQALGFVVEGANRMHDLVRGILEHSKAARGQLERAPVELGEVVEATLRSVRASIDAAGASIEVASPLPLIEADRTQLGQVVQNLVGNALKFHHPGRPPHIRISADRQERGWRLSVADDGIGIDPAHHDRIFGMFQRLNPRSDYPGTGVGLAVCQRIVQRHGGRIWVEAAPGGGSVFHVLLPDPGPSQPAAPGGNHADTPVPVA
jgi:signal transduction histidine kinase